MNPQAAGSTSASERMVNSLLLLRNRGQPVWLDSFRSSLLKSGELARLTEADGLGGVTSSPPILDAALTGSRGLRHTSRRVLRGRFGCGLLPDLARIEEVPHG